MVTRVAVCFASSDPRDAPQVLTAPGRAGQRVGARYGRVYVLFKHGPTFKAGTGKLADHAREVHITLAELAEHSAPDGIEVADSLAPDLLDHAGPNVLQME